MIYIFILLNMFLYLISIYFYKYRNNPISIYVFVWTVSITFYEIKLIYYNTISILTWLVIILFELVFTVSCIIGSKIKFFTYCKKDYTSRQLNDEKLKKNLKKYIIMFSVFAMIAILTGFVSLLRTYKVNIIGAISLSMKIYNDRLSGENKFFTIPYLSSFVYTGMIFSGIYYKKYGFKWFMIMPIILMSIQAIGSGNRYGIIIGILMFFAPLFINVKKEEKDKASLLNKLLLLVGVFCLSVVFIAITSIRSSWILIDSNVSPLLAKLMSQNNIYYKLYTYIASPVGVLDAFLKEPYTAPPGSITFAFIYNLLERFGIIIESYSKVSKSYSIPILVNTGTYIKDFILEYSGFSIIFTFIFGLTCGLLYRITRNGNSIVIYGLYSIIFTLLSLSFFNWYMAETLFWINIFIVIIVGNVIDKRCIENV